MLVRRYRGVLRILATAGCLVSIAVPAVAQSPPSPEELGAYTGLHAAVVGGSTAEIERLVREGRDIGARDGFGRTPLMVAVYRRDIAVARTLIEFGADPNALDHQSYDIMTIAAVRNDLELLKLVIAAGANPRAIISPYGETALIAAARVGHAAVVEALIAARAPLDHTNNLGRTALTEAIVQGDGGPRYQATVEALIKGGVNVNLAGRQGTRPLTLARQKGHTRIAEMLQQAGAEP